MNKGNEKASITKKLSDAAAKPTVAPKPVAKVAAVEGPVNGYLTFGKRRHRRGWASL